MSNLSIKRLQVGNSTAGNNFVIRQPDAADATLRISNGNIGTTTDLVTINASGSVGIGNTSPSAYNAALTLQRSGQSSLMLWNSGIGSGQLGFTAASPNLKLYNTYADGLLPNGKGIDIDTAGRITMPNQTMFSAWNVGGSTISGNVILNTVLVDTGGNYSTSTGRFTAPIAGKYMFHFTGFMEANATSGDVHLYKNGGSFVRTFSNEATGVYRPFAISCIATMAAGDYMQPFAVANLHGNANAIFSGYLVG
jgi:hypothetical protein